VETPTLERWTRKRSDDLDVPITQVMHNLVRLMATHPIGVGLKLRAAQLGLSLEVVMAEALEVAAYEGRLYAAGVSGEDVLDLLVDFGQVKSSPEIPHRKDKLARRQEDYLQWLMSTCSLAAAAQGLGISPGLPYHWARKSEEFNQRWNEARAFAGIKEL